jgi:hypothetical protein
VPFYNDARPQTLAQAEDSSGAAARLSKSSNVSAGVQAQIPF